MTPKNRLFLFCLFGVGVVGGCSKDSNPETAATISGTITFHNKPLPGGTVRVYNAKDFGGAKMGVIHEDGSFSIAGVPTGDVVITVETESMNPKRKILQYGGNRGQQAVSKSKDKQMQTGTPKETGSAEKYQKIPDKYADMRKSTLKTSLSAGSNKQDFDLKD
jgi:hypothetical protein